MSARVIEAFVDEDDDLVVRIQFPDGSVRSSYWKLVDFARFSKEIIGPDHAPEGASLQ